MSMFERQQSIAEEELRLNKRKQKLALEVEMAKLEATPHKEDNGLSAN